MKIRSRRNILKSLAKFGAAAPFATHYAQALAAKPTPSKSQPSIRADKQATEKLMAYFAETAPRLLRPAEGILAHPSIAPSLPGKEYSTSLWDWDTLWTTRGLFQFAKKNADHELHSKIIEHAEGSLLNFLDHQSEEGRIPIMISVTNPDPFGVLSPANPNHKNQAKPVFGQLAQLIADEKGSADWLTPHFDKLLRFYDSWTRGNQTPLGLFVWGDDVAIGDDNDPTTFGRPFFSSANLLLNCLFYADLKSAGELATKLNRTQDAQRLSTQATSLAAQIEKHCWDQRDHFYYTVDVQCVDQRAQLIPSVKPGMNMTWQSLPLKIQMFTGFLPLWCGIATPQHANDLVQSNYLHDERFRSVWGVRSLSSLEKMYSMDFSSNPSNWLGPVWIIVNYLTWKALKNYGFHEAATDLANKTIRLLSADLAKNGSLNEYYHPDTGTALSHKGFMDWNLLVVEMM